MRPLQRLGGAAACGSLALLILGSGCTGHVTFPRSGKIQAIATVEVRRCAKAYEPGELSADQHSVEPQPASTVDAPSAGLRIGAQPWSDDGAPVIQTLPAGLEGAAWLRTPMRRGAVSAVASTQFKRLFIAFPRVDDPPDWLTAQFTRWENDTTPDLLPENVLRFDTGEPDYSHLTVSSIAVLSDFPKSADGGVIFDIWSREIHPPSAPSNPDVIEPVHDAVTIQLPADARPYFAILRARSEYNCLAFLPEVHRWEVSLTTEGWVPDDQVEARAIQQVRNRYTDPDRLHCTVVKIDRSNQVEGAEIVRRRYNLNMEPIAYRPSAHAKIGGAAGPAEVQVNISGRVFPAAVEGDLQLESAGGPSMQVERLMLRTMRVQADPIQVGRLSINDMRLDLLTSVEAECQDTSVPYGRLCDEYAIPAGALLASVSGEIDGSEISLMGVNEDELRIEIDQATRQFRLIGGPVSTELPLNDHVITVSVVVDMTGRFTDFAPIPDSGEVVVDGCAERGNRDDIVLDAVSSKTLYGDPLSTDPNDYLWFQNHGAATEVFWGNGRRMTVPNHRLPPGIHKFTLLLYDARGGVTRDDFDVIVTDVTAPRLRVPDDVSYLGAAPGRDGVELEIGEATATDTCFGGDIAISNDAPPNRRFPVGETIVTWTAEDPYGNTATATQRVRVMVVADPLGPEISPPAPLPDLGEQLDPNQIVALPGCGFGMFAPCLLTVTALGIRMRMRV